MRFKIEKGYEHLEDFLTHLPLRFTREEGRIVHQIRNTVKIFGTPGEEDCIVVKKFKNPNFIQSLIYTFFRKSKARRSYEHALRLRELGFDSPTPIMWGECRHGFCLKDSYYVSRYTDYTPFTQAVESYPSKESLPVLDAFCDFVIRLHEKGVEHQDFNHSNILFKFDPGSQSYEFQLIDINRMKFHRGPLTKRRSLENFERLSCPPLPYLYILKRYADDRRWDYERTILGGTYFRLRFSYLRTRKHEVTDWLKTKVLHRKH